MQRMYLEAMEGILADNEKVLLDVTQGNNVMLLPLNRSSGASTFSSAGVDQRALEEAVRSAIAPMATGMIDQPQISVESEPDPRSRERR